MLSPPAPGEGEGEEACSRAGTPDSGGTGGWVTFLLAHCESCLTGTSPSRSLTPVRGGGKGRESPVGSLSTGWPGRGERG